jgi:NAD(P)-dependent dehydrogenase (short-subunit alcohol dehydrogenase family)
MKTALIWGAGGGMGQAIARQLAKENWQVLAAGRNLNSFTDLTDLADFVYDVELSDAFSVQSAITSISQEVNEVDLWVYAAGDIASLRVNEMSPLDWQRILQANLTGAFLTTHYSWPLLSEGAHLFYLGAVSERMRLPGLSAYAAAKAGLEALADVVRKESRRKVTVVRPGAVDTRFWSQVPFKLPAHHLKPEQVAARIIQAYTEGHQGQLDM